MALAGSDFFLMVQNPAAVITYVSRCGQSDLLTWQCQTADLKMLKCKALTQKHTLRPALRPTVSHDSLTLAPRMAPLRLREQVVAAADAAITTVEECRLLMEAKSAR
jgi:hypothetical protein